MVEEPRRTSAGLSPSDFAFGVLRGFLPPSCVLVGTFVVVVGVVKMEPSSAVDPFVGVAGRSGVDGSRSRIFRLRRLTTWSDTVAAFNRGIVNHDAREKTRFVWRLSVLQVARSDDATLSDSARKRNAKQSSEHFR
jgi:hypothetical protein